MENTYDLIVLGGGPGGYVAAIRASQLGLRTAVVEKRPTLGGTCLNVGCIPSKALLDSSEFFAKVRDEGARHGVSAAAPKLDLAAMMARKDGVVKKLTGGVATLMKANRITVHHGVGTVPAPGVVEVTAVDPEDGANKSAKKTGESSRTTRAVTLKGKTILLATGSVPVELPFMPFDGRVVVDSTGALAFDRVPDHLVVVGGGVIGLELGSVWRRLGARVTVVELLPQILAGWDSSVARTMKRELEKQGIEFMLETKVTGVKVRKGSGKKRDRATVTATDRSGTDLTLEGDRVLVAVGRKPNLEGFDPAALGMETDQGRIVVDRDFSTSVAGIRAIGDILRGPMLAHKAEDEGIAVAELIAGKAGHVNYETVPNVLYTEPEAASVGRTEDELKSAGTEFRVGSCPFAANGRALAIDNSVGSVRVLADARTDRILGAHVVGPSASELIAEIVSVMEFGGSAEDIARTVHAHPTLSETVKEAALGVAGRMIHGKN